MIPRRFDGLSSPNRNVGVTKARAVTEDWTTTEAFAESPAYAVPEIRTMSSQIDPAIVGRLSLELDRHDVAFSMITLAAVILMARVSEVGAARSGAARQKPIGGGTPCQAEGCTF